jgi:hypothetical protein
LSSKIILNSITISDAGLPVMISKNVLWYQLSMKCQQK